ITWNINAGWITIEDAGALGQPNGTTPQVETVASGAALHLLSLAAVATNDVQTVTLGNATGGTFTLTLNGQTTVPIAFNAPATGAALPAYPLIDRQGAIMNLAGVNTIGGFLGATPAGDIQFQGQIGIGVEQIYQNNVAGPNFNATANNVASQLTLAGNQSGVAI